MNNIKKYPRTPHLPWSLGVSFDDLKIVQTRQFEGHEVVVTEKLDGENMTLYNNFLHARSTAPCSHPSQSWIKAFHAQICHTIPNGWRICGENMFAQHAIPYDALESYFYIFSIWNEENLCLSWDETLEWSKQLSAPTPYTFYRGIWNSKHIQKICFDQEKCEGYVVRKTAAFHYNDFQLSVAKCVRKGHVAPNSTHWSRKSVIPNQIKIE